jgi:hypothetical protein
VDVRIGIPDESIRPAILNAGLEAVTRLNEDLIREGKAPDFDAQMRNGVKWQPEPPGLERFDHALTVHRRGWGDCDDLAPLHAATLRARGEDPEARAIVFQSGPHRWHAITQRGDGSLEDPSQTAGMATRKGSRADGIPAAVVGRMAGVSVSGEERPYVAVTRDQTGWVGRTDLPIGKGNYALAVEHRDVTPAKAMAGAMSGACLVGGCSGMAAPSHVHKLYALSGLLKGQRPRQVAAVVGAETTREAIHTLAELCPAILAELRAHRQAVEGGGRRAAGRPFDVAAAYDNAVTVGFSFGSLLHDVGKVVKGAAGVIQGVVSLVPGIGTGISAAIGAGMAALEGGSPIEIALNAAFGAIPIPPGAREVAQGALNAVMNLVSTKNLGDAAVAAVRSQLPGGLAQQVFDTLSHVVLSHAHGRATTGIVTHPANKPTKIVPLTQAKHFVALHRIAPVPVAPVAKKVVTLQLAPATAPKVVAPPKEKTRGAWVFA